VLLFIILAIFALLFNAAVIFVCGMQFYAHEFCFVKSFTKATSNDLPPMICCYRCLVSIIEPCVRFIILGWFPLIPVFFERVAEVRDSPKFFKILRIEMKNYSHHLDNGNVLNITSMDIAPFITNLLDDI
jgi:hypothetical protein